MRDAIFSEAFMDALVVRVADELEARGAVAKGPQQPWTVEQLADRLGDISTDTIYRRVRANEIARVPNVGRVLIPFCEVERLLEGRAV